MRKSGNFVPVKITPYTIVGTTTNMDKDKEHLGQWCLLLFGTTKETKEGIFKELFYFLDRKIHNTYIGTRKTKKRR